MHRKESFDEKISRKLHNPAFAQNFLEGLIEAEDGQLSYEDALRDVISVMGISEFAHFAKVPQPRVTEFLNGKALKPDTLDRLLKPFKLKTKLVFEKIA